MLFRSVADAGNSYYAKFARVMNTLLQTFRENKNVLSSNMVLKTNDKFAEPMITVQELKLTLDQRIKKIEIHGMFDMFVRMMDANQEEWRLEDENKITRLVTEFFVGSSSKSSKSNSENEGQQGIFEDFTYKTITSYLEDKYGIQPPGRTLPRV